MEHLWNNTDRGKTEEPGEKPVPVTLFHHKSHMDWAGVKPGLSGERPATKRRRWWWW